MIPQLRVYGRPAPKGSMTCIGARGRSRHQLIESDDGGHRRRWRKTLTQAAAQLAGALDDDGEGGVVVGVLILIERPAAAKGRLLPLTRASGDVDKHARMCLDSLQDAEVFVDDSRVSLVIAGKTYAPDGKPGAIIWVAPVGTRPGRILDLMLNAAPALCGPPTLI